MTTVDLEAVEDRYFQFNRKIISMSGPSTDELVRTRIIVTPYPWLICDKYFPLSQKDEKALTVLIPIMLDRDHLRSLMEYRLARPTAEQAIRFASQLRKNEVYRDATIVFPHEPPFFAPIVPSYPLWLTLVWKAEKEIREVCLYNMENRIYWSENAFFAGIALVQ